MQLEPLYDEYVTLLPAISIEDGSIIESHLEFFEQLVDDRGFEFFKNQLYFEYFQDPMQAIYHYFLNNSSGYFIVWDNLTQKPIGIIGGQLQRPEVVNLDICFLSNKLNKHKQPYRALQLYLDFLFNKAKCAVRIQASVPTLRNTKFYSRVFKHEGTLRNYTKLGKNWYNDEVFGIIKAEFNNPKAKFNLIMKNLLKPQLKPIKVLATQI